MTKARAATFRDLHAPGRLLRLANAWDAASARLVESCGAEAIATTSAGVAWAHGYPDGDTLPTPLLVQAIREIVRVLSVPLSADIEGGYSSDPRAVGDLVAEVIAAGAVGINLEDGKAPVDLLCAKIEAARAAGARAGVDVFVNARTDVYLKVLVPADRAVEETIERGRRYRDAGADGLFVPGLAEPSAIQAITSAIDLPVNLLLMAGLPLPDALQALGVRRVSAGSGIAQAALAVARNATRQFLGEGRYDITLDKAFGYGDVNALFRAVPRA